MQFLLVASTAGAVHNLPRGLQLSDAWSPPYNGRKKHYECTKKCFVAADLICLPRGRLNQPDVFVRKERSRRRGFRPFRHTLDAFALLFFFEFIKRQPLMLPKFPHNRPFHSVFQLLTWTSSGKSSHTTGRSTLKLLKLPSLKVICWKLMKIQLLKVAKFYRRLYGRGPGEGGGGTAIYGYGFQAVYPRIGYINQSVWV